MHGYDIALKLLLQETPSRLHELLIGTCITSWLPIELPKIQNPRVDLLGRTDTSMLVQLELQSTNDADMALRMAEYALGIYRQHRSFPRQIVLYVGSAPIRMEARLESPALQFEYELLDIRSLDGEQLLKSPVTSDNVIAVLTNLHNRRAAVERIVRQIGEAPEEQRDFYLQALLTLAGLRQVETLVEEEARKVPVLNDILENKVLGREYKRGELALLRRMIEKRFGRVSPKVDEYLQEKSAAELEELGVRLFDVQSLDELLP